MKELSERKFSPVYLLMGDEPYYIDKIADYITNNAIKEEERDFNQIVLYGVDSTPTQIMDAAHAVPMMAEYQVIIVREAQLLKGIEALEKYLRNPIKTTILVICYKKEAARTKKGWIAEAEKNGVVFESKKIRDYALPAFITSYLKTRKMEIDQKACMMIADSIGADLNRVVSELDKLFIAMPEDMKCITPEFVEQKIGIPRILRPERSSLAQIKEMSSVKTGEVLAKRDVLAAVVYFAAAKHKAPSAKRKNPSSRKIFQSCFQFLPNLPQLPSLAEKVKGHIRKAHMAVLSHELHHSSRFSMPPDLKIRRNTG